MSRRGRVLLILLILALAAWIFTWPLRSRLNRQTAAIEAQTAHEQALIRQQRTLKGRIVQAQHRVNTQPNSFPARLDLANLLLQGGRYLEAAREFHAAARLDPTQDGPHLALAKIFDAANAPDLAALELRLVLQRDPRSVPAITMLAYKYISFGWNRAADDLITRALKTIPNDPHLHAELALIQFQKAGIGGAEQQLLRAQRLAPDDPLISEPLVEVYRQAGRNADALRLIESLLPRTGDKSKLLMDQAQVYLNLRRPTEALQSVEAALKLAPDDPSALYLRALALRDRGDESGYIHALETVYAKSPGTEATLFLLSQYFQRHGEKARATVLLQEAHRQRESLDRVMDWTMQVDARPNDAAAHSALGEAHMAAGDFARGVVEFKRSLELKPGDRAVRSLLVAALRKAGRSAEAAAFAAGGPYHPPITLGPVPALASRNPSPSKT